MLLFQVLTVFTIAWGVLMAVPGPNFGPSHEAEIQDFVNERDENGGYFFRYRTSDGTFRRETGRIQNDVLMVSGSVSWIAPDGQEYSINYVSDEGGYRPMGSHLPSSTSPRLKIPKTNVLGPTLMFLSEGFEGPQADVSEAAKKSLLG